MHNYIYKQLRNTDDSESERLKELMEEIKRILSEKQKQSKVKRLINNSKKPKTELKVGNMKSYQLQKLIDFDEETKLETWKRVFESDNLYIILTAVSTSRLIPRASVSST